MCQAFDNGGFAHPRFAYQHRIVLGTTLQNLYCPANFIIAPDHRVELALARALGQIETVLVQGLALPVSILGADIFAATYRFDRTFQGASIKSGLFQQSTGLALVSCQRKQKHFRGDELIASPLRFLVRDIQQIGQITADRDITTMIDHGRQSLQSLGQCGFQSGDIDAGACQE